VTANDCFTGNDFEIRARVLDNAAGPWNSRMLEATGIPAHWPLLKAMNVVTSRPARATALAAPTRAGRALVMLPWQGRTLIGTSESADERDADDQSAHSPEVQHFLAEVNETFPALRLSLDEVTLVHRGIVPAAASARGLTLLGQHRILNHRDAGAPQVFTVIGVKYTTARLVAEWTVDQVMARLGRRANPCRTAETVLPGAALDERDPVDGVAHAIREEMAHTLVDVVVRRTGIGETGYPGDERATAVADRMQGALGWSDERKTLELAALRNFYKIV
jgi:glycerol-3-phosphate dehydrogenase